MYKHNISLYTALKRLKFVVAIVKNNFNNCCLQVCLFLTTNNWFPREPIITKYLRFVLWETVSTPVKITFLRKKLWGNESGVEWGSVTRMTRFSGHSGASGRWKWTSRGTTPAVPTLTTSTNSLGNKTDLRNILRNHLNAVNMKLILNQPTHKTARIK